MPHVDHFPRPGEIDPYAFDEYGLPEIPHNVTSAFYVKRFNVDHWVLGVNRLISFRK